MNFSRHFRSSLTALLLFVGALMSGFNATPASAATIDVDEALEPCVSEAVKQKLQQWTCTAEGLYVQRDSKGEAKRNPRGQEALEFHEMKAPGFKKSTERVSPEKVKSLLEPTSMAALADEYDTWCENGTICQRLITDYIAETKGNAAYGNQNGAIGA